VRHVPLQVFAGGVSPSHAFMHFVDFGTPVTVAGLAVESGALLFGDRHGLVQIPDALVADLPSVADEMRQREREVIDFCHSDHFSIDKLRSLVAGLLR
jgi:regulator of RNase E activity RraA